MKMLIGNLMIGVKINE
ncbi:hypothetical protein BDFB_010522 [Asbolus verrucosus]|uniref:Uncharacterized protein n=1 Tax=Asbolus verrucosus TaxID=1661398 RepID=A0A482VGZ8_ASBVE|nr:hypothetical protein BDFB_010522 [Asbolus verrucosus]